MIEPNIYCKVSGMVMECISRFYKENKRRPTVIEIGCADGQGTSRFAGFCDRVICIDPMVDGRPDIFSLTKQTLVPNDEKLKLFHRRTQDFNVELVIGCSLWRDTIEEVTKKLSGSLVDILVIDGCHHPFDAVWGDFEAYYSFVSQNGYVIFDDLYEDCIIQAYNKAINEKDFVEVERWSVSSQNILQDCAAIRRK